MFRKDRIDAATFFANSQDPRASRDIFYKAIKTNDLVRTQQALTALQNYHGRDFAVEDDMDRTIIPDFYLRTREAADMFGRRSLSEFHVQVAGWPRPDDFRPMLRTMFTDRRFHHLIYPMISFLGAYYDGDWTLARRFHAEQGATRVRGQFVYNQDHERRLLNVMADLQRSASDMVGERLLDLAASPAELQAMGVIVFVQHLGVLMDFGLVPRDILKRVYVYYKRNNNEKVVKELEDLSRRFPVMGNVPVVGPRLSHPLAATIVNTTHPVLVNKWYAGLDPEDDEFDLTPEPFLTTEAHEDWKCEDEEFLDIGDYTYYYLTDGNGRVVPTRRVNFKTKTTTYNVCMVPLALVNARRLTAASRDRPEVEAQANVCRFVSDLYRKIAARTTDGRFVDPEFKYKKVSLDFDRLDDFDPDLDADVGALTTMLAMSAIGIPSLIAQRNEKAKVVEEVPVPYDRAVANAVLRGIVFGCYARTPRPGDLDRPLGQYPYLTLGDYPVTEPSIPPNFVLIGDVLGIEAAPAPSAVMSFGAPKTIEAKPAPAPVPARAPALPPPPGTEAILTELERRRIEIKRKQDLLRKAEEDRLAAIKAAREKRASAPRALPPPPKDDDDDKFDGNAVSGIFIYAAPVETGAAPRPTPATSAALTAASQRGSPITRIDPTLYSPNAILNEMRTEVLRWHPPLTKRYAGLNHDADAQYKKRPWNVVEMAAADAMFYMSQYATLARLAVLDVMSEFDEDIARPLDVDYTVPPYRLDDFRKLVKLLEESYMLIHPVVKVVPDIKFGIPIEPDAPLIDSTLPSIRVPGVTAFCRTRDEPDLIVDPVTRTVDMLVRDSTAEEGLAEVIANMSAHFYADRRIANFCLSVFWERMKVSREMLLVFFDLSRIMNGNTVASVATKGLATPVAVPWYLGFDREVVYVAKGDDEGLGKLVATVAAFVWGCMNMAFFGAIYLKPPRTLTGARVYSPFDYTSLPEWEDVYAQTPEHALGTDERRASYMGLIYPSIARFARDYAGVGVLGRFLRLVHRHIRDNADFYAAFQASPKHSLRAVATSGYAITSTSGRASGGTSMMATLPRRLVVRVYLDKFNRLENDEEGTLYLSAYLSHGMSVHDPEIQHDADNELGRILSHAPYGIARLDYSNGNVVTGYTNGRLPIAGPRGTGAKMDVNATSQPPPRSRSDRPEPKGEPPRQRIRMEEREEEARRAFTVLDRPDAPLVLMPVSVLAGILMNVGPDSFFYSCRELREHLVKAGGNISPGDLCNAVAGLMPQYYEMWMPLYIDDLAKMPEVRFIPWLYGEGEDADRMRTARRVDVDAVRDSDAYKAWVNKLDQCIRNLRRRDMFAITLAWSLDAPELGPLWTALKVNYLLSPQALAEERFYGRLRRSVVGGDEEPSQEYLEKWVAKHWPTLRGWVRLEDYLKKKWLNDALESVGPGNTYETEDAARAAHTAIVSPPQRRAPRSGQREVDQWPPFFEFLTAYLNVVPYAYNEIIVRRLPRDDDGSVPDVYKNLVGLFFAERGLDLEGDGPMRKDFGNNSSAWPMPEQRGRPVAYEDEPRRTYERRLYGLRQPNMTWMEYIKTVHSVYMASPHDNFGMPFGYIKSAGKIEAVMPTIPRPSAEGTARMLGLRLSGGATAGVYANQQLRQLSQRQLRLGARPQHFPPDVVALVKSEVELAEKELYGSDSGRSSIQINLYDHREAQFYVRISDDNDLGDVRSAEAHLLTTLALLAYTSTGFWYFRIDCEHLSDAFVVDCLRILADNNARVRVLSLMDVRLDAALGVIKYLGDIRVSDLRIGMTTLGNAQTFRQLMYTLAKHKWLQELHLHTLGNPFDNIYVILPVDPEAEFVQSLVDFFRMARNVHKVSLGLFPGRRSLSWLDTQRPREGTSEIGPGFTHFTLSNAEVDAMRSVAVAVSQNQVLRFFEWDYHYRGKDINVVFPNITPEQAANVMQVNPAGGNLLNTGGPTVPLMQMRITRGGVFYFFRDRDNFSDVFIRTDWNIEDTTFKPRYNRILIYNARMWKDWSGRQDLDPQMEGYEYIVGVFVNSDIDMSSAGVPNITTLRVYNSTIKFDSRREPIQVRGLILRQSDDGFSVSIDCPDADHLEKLWRPLMDYVDAKTNFGGRDSWELTDVTIRTDAKIVDSGVDKLLAMDRFSASEFVLTSRHGERVDMTRHGRMSIAYRDAGAVGPIIQYIFGAANPGIRSNRFDEITELRLLPDTDLPGVDLAESITNEAFPNLERVTVAPEKLDIPFAYIEPWVNAATSSSSPQATAAAYDGGASLAPFYDRVRARFPSIRTSDHLGARAPSGGRAYVDIPLLLREDATKLTFDQLARAALWLNITVKTYDKAGDRWYFRRWGAGHIFLDELGAFDGDDAARLRLWDGPIDSSFSIDDKTLTVSDHMKYAEVADMTVQVKAPEDDFSEEAARKPSAAYALTGPRSVLTDEEDRLRANKYYLKLIRYHARLGEMALHSTLYMNIPGTIAPLGTMLVLPLLPVTLVDYERHLRHQLWRSNRSDDEFVRLMPQNAHLDPEINAQWGFQRAIWMVTMALNPFNVLQYEFDRIGRRDVEMHASILSTLAGDCEDFSEAAVRYVLRLQAIKEKSDYAPLEALREFISHYSPTQCVMTTNNAALSHIGGKPPKPSLHMTALMMPKYVIAGADGIMDYRPPPFVALPFILEGTGKWANQIRSPGSCYGQAGVPSTVLATVERHMKLRAVLQAAAGEGGTKIDAPTMQLHGDMETHPFYGEFVNLLTPDSMTRDHYFDFRQGAPRGDAPTRVPFADVMHGRFHKFHLTPLPGAKIMSADLLLKFAAHVKPPDWNGPFDVVAAPGEDARFHDMPPTRTRFGSTAGHVDRGPAYTPGLHVMEVAATTFYANITASDEAVADIISQMRRAMQSADMRRCVDVLEWRIVKVFPGVNTLEVRFLLSRV